MKNFMTIGLFFICLSFIGISCTKNENNKNIQNTISLNGKTSGGVPVKAEVCITEYTARIPYKNGFRWGTELKLPKNLITNVKITFGNEIVFVPLSAYCDLMNSKNYSLKFTENSYRLVIDGGHASAAYTAEIKFENEHIRKRKVFHREFPDAAWEETFYSFNRGNDAGF